MTLPGKIDGGLGRNTLDFSAYTTVETVNMSSDDRLAARIFGGANVGAGNRSSGLDQREQPGDGFAPVHRAKRFGAKLRSRHESSRISEARRARANG